MDDNDVLMKLYEDHSTWERHHESQRATLTSVSIAIAAAITGAITFDRQVTISDLPFAYFLLVQGLLGGLFAQKQYQLFWAHKRRKDLYREAISKAFPNAKIIKLRQAADENNNKKFPVSRRVKLHYFWNSMHFAIAFLGLVVLLIIYQ